MRRSDEWSGVRNQARSTVCSFSDEGFWAEDRVLGEAGSGSRLQWTARPLTVSSTLPRSANAHEVMLFSKNIQVP